MQPPARFRPPVTTAYRPSRHETSEWQVTNSRSPGHVTTPTPAVGHVAAPASGNDRQRTARRPVARGRRGAPPCRPQPPLGLARPVLFEPRLPSDQLLH